MEKREIIDRLENISSDLIELHDECYRLSDEIDFLINELYDD